MEFDWNVQLLTVEIADITLKLDLSSMRRKNKHF